jgi:hypothetical protein
MYTNPYTDSEFGIYRNVRNSTRRGVNYDDDRNVVYEVSRPRDQITLQSSPMYTQDYDTDTRGYRTSQTFRPTEYVSSSIKTPKASRNNYFTKRYVNDNSGLFGTIRRDMSPKDRFRTSDIYERISPINNIRRSTV